MESCTCSWTAKNRNRRELLFFSTPEAAQHCFVLVCIWEKKKCGLSILGDEMKEVAKGHKPLSKLENNETCRAIPVELEDCENHQRLFYLSVRKNQLSNKPTAAHSCPMSTFSACVGVV